MDQQEFDARLGRALSANVDWCQELISVERLSGGASQETYRLVVRTADGERPMALRRAPGGVAKEETIGPGPGLATEALLMQAAEAAGVPEPEVYYVLQPDDGLGDGFAMEWLDGEALGARIARAPEFEALREGLAYECGA